jgi:3-oxoacyl-[acyl-carrier protein] reductase
MIINLKNKNALVTGGSRGIGRETAILLAECGCNVAICARDKTWLDLTKSEIESRGVKCIALSFDANILDDIKFVINFINTSWNSIDILVNNVGGEPSIPSVSHEITPEDIWLNSINLNLLSAIRFTNLAIPLMRINKWGRVVTVSSKHGREGAGRPWYTLAKAAEISFMKNYSLNFQFVRDGITFNSVAPGAILTELGGWADFKRNEPENFIKKMQLTKPLGRLGTTREVASLIVFLCSEHASLINGACIPVDGGESHSY